MANDYVAVGCIPMHHSPLIFDEAGMTGNWKQGILRRDSLAGLSQDLLPYRVI